MFHYSFSLAVHPLLQITQSIVFVTILQFYQDTMELPWTVYGTFVLEQKHGFNNQVRCHTRHNATSIKALAEEAPTAACLPTQLIQVFV